MYQQPYDPLLEAIMKPTGTPTLPKAPDDTAFPTVVPDPPIHQRIGHLGHGALWVLFVLMFLFTLGFIITSWTVPASKRIYHSITTVILLVSTISYFAMATGGGVTWQHHVHHEHHGRKLPSTHHPVIRQVFYARYIEWLLTTPLILFDLFLLAGLNGATIFNALIADVVMILTGLFATFTYQKGPRGGWYAMSVIAYFWIVYTLLVTGRAAATSKGATVSRFYTTLASYTLVLWLVYPIIWGISDGGRIISVDGAIVAYAVLDVLAKAGFGSWLLLAVSRIPETQLTIGGFWAHGINSEGQIRVGDDDEA